MRTNIVIDDNLMKDALRTGYHSKKKAVEDGLKLLIQMKSQKKLIELEGKVDWKGDLKKMRLD